MSSQNELAEVSVENFPELAVQYPEFGLQKFTVCISGHYRSIALCKHAVNQLC